MKTRMIVLFLLVAGAVMAQGDRDDRGGERKDSSPADFIQRLDKDGDGMVSQAEFDGPSEHFTGSDKNNDGFISEDEAPMGPPPGGRK